jgi:hypothetical protein
MSYLINIFGNGCNLVAEVISSGAVGRYQWIKNGLSGAIKVLKVAKRVHQV